MFGENKLSFLYKDFELDLLFDFETIDSIQEIENIPLYTLIGMFFTDMRSACEIVLFHMVNSKINMINETRTKKIKLVSTDMIKKIINENETEILTEIMNTVTSCMPISEEENKTESNSSTDRLNVALWMRNALRLGLSEDEFRKSSLKKINMLINANNEENKETNIDDIIPF